jgi:hypothetical protein
MNRRPCPRPESPIVTAIANDGWHLVQHVVPIAVCDRLAAAIDALPSDERQGGHRNGFAIPGIADLARSTALRRLVEPILGSEAFAVRALLFNKIARANWQVPWHRDRLIAVRERHAVDGFRAWSEKDGVPHVEPPRAILENMLAVRLHLDAIDADNAPLRIVDGSHEETEDGPVDAARVSTMLAPRGSVLLMRPLCRHASSPAHVPRQRRIVHLEFAADDLPAPLAWHEHR